MTLFLVILSLTEMTRHDKSNYGALGTRLASALTNVASLSLGGRPREVPHRDGLPRGGSSRHSPQTPMQQGALALPPSYDTTTTTTHEEASTSLAEAAPITPQLQQPYYSIRFVDADTNRGIPLVYLRTEYKAIYVTDSAGYVAFNEPELMTGQGLWLNVASYGYETPQAGFGTEGMQVFPLAGGAIVLSLKRTQVAERLYRMTGYGIYRDSVLLHQPTPLTHPILNAQVAGSDTIQCAKFHDQLFWMWQDTDQIAWPLGNFNMTGATTTLDVDANQGFDFHYLTEGANDDPNTFARPLAKVPLDTPGSYPIWVDGLTVVPDAHGRERLVARYYASGPNMECVEEGLVHWNETTQRLDKIARLPPPRPRGCGGLAPHGHTYYVRAKRAAEDGNGNDKGNDKDNGTTRYAYYGRNIRVRADYASASDPSQYEAFTCLSADGTTAQRDAHGALVWRWVKGGTPVNYETSPGLVRDGTLRADETTYRLVDVDTGRALQAAQVGLAWNPYLRLWVNIVQEHLGDTTAGEIWFATARAPEGPWVQAKKVATHYMHTQSFQNNSNDLYNPVQHYELMGNKGKKKNNSKGNRQDGKGKEKEKEDENEEEEEEGRFVYFSGTFVNTFSGNSWSTPLYHYNNLMYRLDLNQSSLQLPTPPEGLWDTTPDEW